MDEDDWSLKGDENLTDDIKLSMASKVSSPASLSQDWATIIFSKQH